MSKPLMCESYVSIELLRFVDRAVDSQGAEPLIHSFRDRTGEAVDPMAVYEVWFSVAMSNVDFGDWRGANEAARIATADMLAECDVRQIL